MVRIFFVQNTQDQEDEEDDEEGDGDENIFLSFPSKHSSSSFSSVSSVYVSCVSNVSLHNCFINTNFFFLLLFFFSISFQFFFIISAIKSQMLMNQCWCNQLRFITEKYSKLAFARSDTRWFEIEENNIHIQCLRSPNRDVFQTQFFSTIDL